MTVSTPATERRLILLRHAKAEHHGAVNDEMRALTLAGRRQAFQVGASLAAAGLFPDAVLCSSAVRTRQTYELLASGLGSTADVTYSDELYGAGIGSVLEVVAEAPGEARTLLVVGHEPVISGAAWVLAGPGSDEASLARVRIGVPTGAYCVLRCPVGWDELTRGAAVLAAVVATPHH
jgi:phosphohistidine phosphatase